MLKSFKENPSIKLLKLPTKPWIFLLQDKESVKIKFSTANYNREPRRKGLQSIEQAETESIKRWKEAKLNPTTKYILPQQMQQQKKVKSEKTVQKPLKPLIENKWKYQYYLSATASAILPWSGNLNLRKPHWE